MNRRSAVNLMILMYVLCYIKTEVSTIYSCSEVNGLLKK